MIIKHILPNWRLANDKQLSDFLRKSMIAKKLVFYSPHYASDNVIYISYSVSPLGVLGTFEDRVCRRDKDMEIERFRRGAHTLIRIPQRYIRLHKFDNYNHIEHFCKDVTFAYAINRQVLFIVSSFDTLKHDIKEYRRFLDSIVDHIKEPLLTPKSYLYEFCKDAL